MLIEQYDAICKKLLSEKMVITWILKESVNDFKNYDVSFIADNCLGKGSGTRVFGVDTVDKDPEHGEIRYDLCFKAKGENGEVIVNIEAQNYTSSVSYPLVKRAGYYCSRLIYSQKNTEFSGMDYGKIKKVYSIWINFGVEKEYENVISRFYIMQMHSNGKKMYEEKDYAIFEIIFLSLEKEGYNTSNMLLRMLNVIFSHNLKLAEKNAILKEEYGFELTEREEYESMCNFGEAIYEDGIEKGMISANYKSIKSLVEKCGFTIDQALDAISIVNVNEREEIIKLLND